MENRGLVDKKGELFAYIEGGVLYTLEGEATGRVEGDYIVDLAGNRVWQIIKDGIYSRDGSESIGFLSSASPGDS